jgi:predicted RNase H-like nuclease
MFVLGVDGCGAGWVGFRVELPAYAISVKVIDLADILRNRPDSLLCIAIDIPIGLPNGSRACDKAARKLLGWPRRNSVFSPPCRESLAALDYAAASRTNLSITGRGLSQQAWGIASKIKEVDDAIAPECQQWAFEVHPEVCFWAMAGERPMAHRMKTKAGMKERIDLLANAFPDIERHLLNRPRGVGRDDLLDSAAAAWTALRLSNREAQRVCTPERDAKRLEVAIWY